LKINYGNINIYVLEFRDAEMKRNDQQRLNEPELIMFEKMLGMKIDVVERKFILGYIDELTISLNRR
jgi:hypothetical protein